MRTLDYLPNTNIYLYQDKDMFRINSDTRYLGEFIKVNKDDEVLDIGTNNGALLLYVNILGCKKLIGVDINSKAIELCEENMKLNNIVNYELHNCKVQNLVISPVDVIVCNPPYFNSGRRKENENLKNARHDDNLDVEDLAKSCSKLLKDNGKVFIVYKSSEIVNFIDCFKKYNFGVRELKFIYDQNKEYSNCFLIEMVKGYKSDVKVTNPIIITH